MRRFAKRIHFPSIETISKELRRLNQLMESESDVRLQVYEDGAWAIRTGDSSYDQDHRGYWGSGFLPGDNKRFASIDTARELIEQARNSHSESRNNSR